MGESDILETIEQNGYNSKDVLNKYFDIYINDDDNNNDSVNFENDKEYNIIEKKIKNLKNYINEEKIKLNNKINEETTHFKEKNFYVKKYIDNIIISNINTHLNVNQIYHKNINEHDQSTNICLKTISKKKSQNIYTQLKDLEYNTHNYDQNGKSEHPKHVDSDWKGYRMSIKMESENGEKDGDGEDGENGENDENGEKDGSDGGGENVAELLERSIELKEILDKIKKSLLFLKCYPSIEKNIKELLLLSRGQSNIDINEKIKNVLKIYENLIYINEHEEIIKDLKKKYFFDNFYSIYSNNFFEDLYFLLNNIIFEYMINNVNININEIVKIYIYLLNIFFNYLNIKEYDYEYQINYITNKLIHYIVENCFSKTFFKFVQSKQNILIYNIIIIYYEYFTSFIEEKKESMINLLHIFIDKLSEEFRKKRTVSESEKQAIGKRDDQTHIDTFFANLFKESINVVCVYIEDLKIFKSIDDNTNKSNMVFKIMESINTSINILVNIPFFINKKNVLEKILKETIFINKEIINEYIINITNVSKFYNNSFEDINLKVRDFDRHNLLFQNKLLIFFTDLQNDIKNIIDNKINEINNNTIFNLHFFRFLIFFSYIHYIDTQFLFLFINIYNFLYEIIYNFKDEIKTKEMRHTHRKKNINDHTIFGLNQQNYRVDTYNVDNYNADNYNVDNKPNKENSQIIIDKSLQTQEYYNTSNMVIEYIKSIISIFFNLINIFDIIFNDYINLSSYIFERTYYNYNNNSYINILSKFYISREKIYPTEIYANIAHLHNFFFHADFSKKKAEKKAEKNKSDSHNNNDESTSLNDQNKLEKENIMSMENDNSSSSWVYEENKLSINGDQNYKSVIFEDNELEEYGTYLFKSSISKLKEIKNTIKKNIIHFSLIPLYDYLNKYIEQICYIQYDETIHFFDPHENICLLGEVIFSFVEIYYENKNTNLLQELFSNLSEKYFLLINKIKIINKNIILQIQADLNYLINVCIKFKIKNYKFLFLLNLFFSFYFSVIGNNNFDNIDIYTSFQSYVNEKTEKEKFIDLEITCDDISRTTTNMIHIFKDQSSL
ncbi:conserved Plasmodium protein, unknown function [Plasmodium yoelii]|uniref:Uncharacterized protein n=3 Tax=Plasmodium yoelii TaxID=5861 RepID=A0AAF0B433_PLAYO|nr:conserved Plasmodium protein, unknown function [Plasmodium yoelii]WBY56699.1 hypothetical protein Py17XNL_000801740 [Plasmodium yoelii yoelii]CDU17538.1 conserved Plasmodium protein, unknown function [Plasmodium yoelii]VTZ77354.1 conserved Plasmodium protein, unknown function [Plasmodium yoelii]|eukprot:XP_730361.2 conserved Plasmodium protein, unknown function [Plasmodium yoelii]